MRYCVILGELVLFNLKEEGLINLNVLELFAGVGGFRVGLEKASPTLKTLWSNQFERRESRKMPLRSTITISQTVKIGTKTSLKFPTSAFLP